MIQFTGVHPRKPDAAETAALDGVRLATAGDLEAAIAAFDRALEHRPAYPQALANRGFALRRLNRIDESLASLEAAIALAPNYAEARWNRSLILLLQGRFEEGWQEYEWRKRTRAALGHRDLPGKSWTGETLPPGTELFIYGEQGLGDTLQFARYLPMLVERGARVFAEVQTPLLGLFRRQWPAIRFLPPGMTPAGFDHHVALLSLAGLLKTDPDSFPGRGGYLTASPEVTERWRKRIPARRRRRIGVVWSGSATHANDVNRSIPFAKLSGLLEVDADWFVLQPDVRPDDAAGLQACQRIIDVGRDIVDYEETAALVSLMDLVITVDTSVAHLAGAMNVPTWIAVPALHDWRWLQGIDYSPWYDSVRLFRQDSGEDWSSVLARMKAALADQAAPAMKS